MLTQTPDNFLLVLPGSNRDRLKTDGFLIQSFPNVESVAMACLRYYAQPMNKEHALERLDVLFGEIEREVSTNK